MATALAAVAMVAQVVVGQPSVVIPPVEPAPSADFLAHYHFKPAEVMGTLRAYHDAVRQYRRGDSEGSIEAVRQLPPAQLDFVIETLRSQGRIATTNPALVASLPFDWTRADLAAAAMLHGDMTIAAVGRDIFEPQLRLALSVLQIADEAKPNTTERPGTWTRDWLRAFGNLLLADADWWDLSIVLNYAQILFRDDGPLLLVRGTALELQSAGAAPAVDFTSTAGFAIARRDRDQLRHGAVEALTRAVHLMPDSTEAAVRLAHVYELTHQDTRATALLDRALRSSVDRWWYAAALMRGGVYERAGQTADAERLYTAVIQRFPGAQSAYVALAMLQYASGRREESLATLDRMYARPASSDSDDPWWQYGTAMWAEADVEVKRMRAEVRR